MRKSLTLEEFVQLRDLCLREAYAHFRNAYNTYEYHRFLEYASIANFLYSIIRFMRGELDG